LSRQTVQAMAPPALPTVIWEHIIEMAVANLHEDAQTCSDGGPLLQEHEAARLQSDLCQRSCRGVPGNGATGAPHDMQPRSGTCEVDAQTAWGFGGLASVAPRATRLRGIVEACLKIDAFCCLLRIRPLPYTLWAALVTRRCALIPITFQMLSVNVASNLLSLTPKQIAVRLRRPVEPRHVLALHAHMHLDECMQVGTWQ
jgi:hypothetical protein